MDHNRFADHYENVNSNPLNFYPSMVDNYPGENENQLMPCINATEQSPQNQLMRNYYPQNYSNYSTFTPPTSNPSEKEQNDEGCISLKLAIGMVPHFSGETSSLFTFIRKSREAYDLVKSKDKASMLALIRSKISGYADTLMSQHGRPKDLNELISILRKTFAPAFDTNKAHTEIVTQSQKDNETAGAFGARISEILNRALESAAEHFDATQKVGVQVMLKHAAVSGFVSGLRDKVISTIIMKDNLNNLEDAINMATRLDQNSVCNFNKLLTSHEPGMQTYLTTSKIHKIDQDQRRCYNCNEVGHLKNNCPNARSNYKKSSEPYRKEHCSVCKYRGHNERDCKFNVNSKNYKHCNFCEKAGHIDAECRLKTKQTTKQQESSNSNHLNWKNAPRQDQPQSRNNVITGRNLATE